MNWLKDPLVSFLAIGAAIFLVTSFFSGEEISYDVEISENDVERLRDQWELQMRRPPSREELWDLLNQFVREEIYYRESQRLGLDVNDSIVRQRMVQKLTFLTEDIATASLIAESELEEYFKKNQDEYRVAARYTFSHRYFSVDRREDAEADARRALNTQEPGDPFMLQKYYSARSESQIGDLFGRDFAKALSALDVSSSSQGPIESAYGWHVVQLKTKEIGHVPDFFDVLDKVSVDAKQAARLAANKAYYEGLRERYNVVLPETLEEI